MLLLLLLLSQACAALPVDIITLPLAQGLPYRITAAVVKPAVARGVHFEVGRLGLVSLGQLESARCTAVPVVIEGGSKVPKYSTVQ